jgi:hypothetical protein
MWLIRKNLFPPDNSMDVPIFQSNILPADGIARTL